MNPNPHHHSGDDPGSPDTNRPSYHRPKVPHGDDDRLLTIDEAAELTRLPKATLRYKRHDGSGPRSFRMGRRVFFWLSDVIAWIDQHYNDDDPRQPDPRLKSDSSR